VDGLDLKLIGDFRADSERTMHGLEVVKTPVTRFAVTDPQDSVVSDFVTALTNKDVAAIDALLGHGKGRAAMIAGYKNFVTQDSANAAFAGLVQQIAGKHVPALYHCVSGKDRTGFATAILLRAVGVAEDKVMADYMLSNTYRESTIQAMLAGFTPDVFDATGRASARKTSRPRCVRFSGSIPTT
jgi:protein-tyrosine phosphatase